MLSFKHFILEYLTDDQEKKWSKYKMSPKARADTDHFFGAGTDHVSEPLKNYSHDKSEVHKQVERHLGKDLTHDEYKSGKTSDKYGREVKLGKSIKDEKLRNDFSQDSTRAGAHKHSLSVSVVRGHHVAGQTNSEPNKEHPKGHSWGQESCKNITNGINKGFIPHEIKHGTVVTRVHDHNGQEIYRAAHQPYHNKDGHVAYDVNSEYGIKHPSFTAHAHDVAKRLSGKIDDKDVAHKIHDEVYDDRSSTQMMLHPNATSAHLDKALDDKDRDVRRAAVKHPNATSAHLDKALNDEDYSVRSSAARNPNATSAHLDKALNDEDYTVRKAAARNPNATSAHLDKALNDEHGYVKISAAYHHNATSAHLDKAMNDEDRDVRATAAGHRNATSAHLDKALNDEHYTVRSSAAAHPNASSAHLDKALNDENPSVRRVAANHPNASSAHLDKALNDKDSSVRKAARNNKKI